MLQKIKKKKPSFFYKNVMDILKTFKNNPLYKF